MGLDTHLTDVLQTEDRGHVCYDVTVTAQEIAQLWRTGFLRIDDDRQRGRDPVTGKPIVDQDKVERWTDELIAGTAILGQLSWNFRPEDVGELRFESDENGPRLVITPGAYMPDSRHRHESVVKAVDSVQKGSAFDPARKLSVRVYNVSADEENRIFYAMNQEGQKADSTRSKWLHPRDAAVKLAAELVKRSPHLRGNVDTVRDRMSKRNPRLTAFNTLAQAFEKNWSDAPADTDRFEDTVEYLVAYWEHLVGVLPALGVQDIADRIRFREASLVDSALAIHAYVALARLMRKQDQPLSVLDKLSNPIVVNGEEVPFFDRRNPDWERIGVLVPSTRRDGSQVLVLRNARQAREAMSASVAHRVGLAPAPPERLEDAVEREPEPEPVLA